MYLVDTNIWLEALLEQVRASEARDFFQKVEAHLIAMTDFSLYSIGVILTRLNKDEVFEDFISDTLEDSGIIKISLDSCDLKRLLKVRCEYRMDFDDAYQYTAAEKHGFQIISFDQDFVNTELGRLMPRQVNL